MPGATKTHHSHLGYKAQFRARHLPEDAKVLDLFCGSGGLYDQVYKFKATRYQGVDIKTIHDPKKCIIMDNTRYVRTHNIDPFNVFDLDAYGSPWELFFTILKRIKPGTYTFFMTDDLVLHQRYNKFVTRFVSATEHLPKKMNIPGLERFYVDIFLTMIYRASMKWPFDVKAIHYFHNSIGSVFYWYLLIERLKDE